MPIGKGEQKKWVALAALVIVCSWLVYRNLILPARKNPSEPLTPSVAAAGQSTLRQRDDLSQPDTSPSQIAPVRPDHIMNQQELATLDPTLRLDLLEKSAKVEYEGGTRNIFQVYTPPPPPKPVVNPLVTAPLTPGQSGAPPQVNIPLKFYGMSSHQGSPEKKAFLTDGEEIFIGTEGDVIAKRYKIVRIGVNSLEMEDTQSHKRGELPLIQE